MHIVAVAWIFVVVLMAAAEATSTQGSVLGALFTLLLYGALPLGIVLYVMGTPARRRARARSEADLEEEPLTVNLPQASGSAADTASAGAHSALQADASSHAPGDRLTPVREEPRGL